MANEMDNRIGDGRGGYITPDRMTKIRAAHAAMMELTDHERGYVTCWFCKGCDRYMGPGDWCHCQNDE